MAEELAAQAEQLQHTTMFFTIDEEQQRETDRQRGQEYDHTLSGREMSQLPSRRDSEKGHGEAGDSSRSNTQDGAGDERDDEFERF